MYFTPAPHVIVDRPTQLICVSKRGFGANFFQKGVLAFPKPYFICVTWRGEGQKNTKLIQNFKGGYILGEIPKKFPFSISKYGYIWIYGYIYIVSYILQPSLQN